MSVVRTDKWVKWYLQDVQSNRSKKEYINAQKSFFVEPLTKWFDEEFAKSLHSFLIDQGLFLAEKKSNEELTTFLELTVWQDVQTFFMKLKKQWNGPDIPIYLLPINPAFEDPAKKAGVSFPFAIFLFIGPHLLQKEIEALVLHEYHHTVRLLQTGKTEESITLLESMYMEGLAECAVLEFFGEDQLAPWTSLHQDQWKQKWYRKWIAPNLDQQGRSKHRKYLYGDARLRIPAMLGYYVGYQLARASSTKRPEWKTDDWLRFTGEECETWLKEVLKSMNTVE
ncbi:DUF2268 domain-containing protein [Alkalicoccobacillus plakortidis]|uniref:DUF2268 domain-containing protein n=1 Tax=Alkalicoccobacillus plakortidis TaxID=444060 RepID=A0ABT0XGR1_9BACI|nr:DUF2268 domain-containing putative Zn-dependent protease [Alkalicoccobacillus plakortidis]MCM2675069.1 DUF2268 domain-containing protein [Alkalicoccobacillus plakortidis]